MITSGHSRNGPKALNVQSMTNRAKFVRGIEIACWVLGVTLLVVYTAARTHAVLASEQGIKAFEEARLTVAKHPAPGQRGEPRDAAWDIPTPDQSSWSEGRIAAYQESLRQDTDLPEAVMRIPSIDLVVPVYGGASELNLNRGVARVLSTARPGTRGNVGIAGHRDGYFRGLKDAQIGDEVEVETLTGSLTYRISSFMVVDPKDVHVLAPTEAHTITLVTCYPFYFVGHAPRRYIVRAELAN